MVIPLNAASPRVFPRSQAFLTLSFQTPRCMPCVLREPAWFSPRFLSLPKVPGLILTTLMNWPVRSMAIRLLPKCLPRWSWRSTPGATCQMILSFARQSLTTACLRRRRCILMPRHQRTPWPPTTRCTSTEPHGTSSSLLTSKNFLAFQRMPPIARRLQRHQSLCSAWLKQSVLLRVRSRRTSAKTLELRATRLSNLPARASRSRPLKTSCSLLVLQMTRALPKDVLKAAFQS